jgi:DNA-3-methyladenine glycosylase
MHKLPLQYYCENKTLWLAEDLLGKILLTRSDDGIIRSGIITETEAYLGVQDKASHAWNNRYTKRTSIMYQRGGVAYVYLCYGIHCLFNIVTEFEDIPNAVLIRGIIKIRNNNPNAVPEKLSTNFDQVYDGPGKLTKALDINLSHNNESLSGGRVWIEEHGIKPVQGSVFKGSRIGVDYAGEDAKLPYRFWVDPEKIMISEKLH